MITDSISKIGLPASIIIASIVLGLAFYFVQVQKQNSIEEQQRMESANKAESEELAQRRAECQTLSKGVMDTWGNVMGVTYSDLWEEMKEGVVD